MSELKAYNASARDFEGDEIANLLIGTKSPERVFIHTLYILQENGFLDWTIQPNLAEQKQYARWIAEGKYEKAALFVCASPRFMVSSIKITEAKDVISEQVSDADLEKSYVCKDCGLLLDRPFEVCYVCGSEHVVLTK
jgi:hypothetical protein